MIRRTVTLPQVALIAGTRVALGAGVGLLLADRFDRDRRREVGWALTAIGVVTTIPLLAGLLSPGHRVIRPKLPTAKFGGRQRTDLIGVPV